eukprot:30524-Rhodomonas_salina.1
MDTRERGGEGGEKKRRGFGRKFLKMECISPKTTPFAPETARLAKCLGQGRKVVGSKNLLAGLRLDGEEGGGGGEEE